MLQFSEEAARKLEGIYSTPDIVAQRRTALDLLALVPGESVVDIGCGPGFLCEQMAEIVGSKGRVLGIDVSDDLLALARNRNKREWLTYQPGDAKALKVSDSSFDVAVSAQVLEYVNDPDRALSEMHRVLKPGGRAVIMNTDWDRVAWYATDLARMTKVRRAWEEHCAHPRLPQTLAHRLREAGLELTCSTTFPIVNTRLSPDTYSYGLAGLIVDFLAERDSIPREELDAWLADLRELSDEGRYFFSTTRCFFCVTKPTTLAGTARRRPTL
jgi:ubiquinone/menaquinone biosynthesis C-methylase UbiE